MTKYAVKVPLLGLDREWVYVTKNQGDLIALYDTEQAAVEAAKIWKTSKIVRYRSKEER